MAPPDWKRYSPDPTPEGEPSREPRSLDERTVRARGHGLLVAGIVGAVALLGVTSAIIGTAGDSDDAEAGASAESSAAEPTDAAPAGDAGQSSAGFAELLDALEEETGSTMVFEAVIYPKYAVVEAPYRPGDVRAVRYYWDGALDESSKGTSTYRPFDLADVDSTLFPEMCAEARRLVEDPKDCYLIVRSPGATDTAPAPISAYISNEFSQGGYIEYDLEGVEVDRHTW